jgi:hypothetical protein
MPSSNSKTTKTEGLDLFFFSIPSEVLLQLGTGAMVLGVLGSKAVDQTVQAIGQASEEVFRGDRLPLLKFPVETDSVSS